MSDTRLETLLARRDLSFDEAHNMMTAIMTGKVSRVRLAGLLIALRAKGETSDEIAGCAAAMREHSLRIRPRRRGLVDTCGTGGDARGGRSTFNISTASALVAAGMGIPVAKHGNRAVSSRCGSADLLEALGVNLDVAPEQVAEIIDAAGIGFLYAPHLHPAMKYAADTRRELGLRTIFNLLGPLTNPADVRRQLLGVFDADLTETMAAVLRSLGTIKAFVVHGADGSDEVSLCGHTRVSALDNGSINTFDFTPEEAGLRRAAPAQLAGGNATDNAQTVRSLLAGEPGPRLDSVLLNTGFVAVLADRCNTVAEGVELARAAVNDGRAIATLDNLIAASQAMVEEAS